MWLVLLASGIATAAEVNEPDFGAQLGVGGTIDWFDCQVPHRRTSPHHNRASPFVFAMAEGGVRELHFFVGFDAAPSLLYAPGHVCNYFLAPWGMATTGAWAGSEAIRLGAYVSAGVATAEYGIRAALMPIVWRGRRHGVEVRAGRLPSDTFRLTAAYTVSLGRTQAVKIETGAQAGAGYAAGWYYCNPDGQDRTFTRVSHSPMVFVAGEAGVAPLYAFVGLDSAPSYWYGGGACHVGLGPQAMLTFGVWGGSDAVRVGVYASGGFYAEAVGLRTAVTPFQWRKSHHGIEARAALLGIDFGATMFSAAYTVAVR